MKDKISQQKDRSFFVQRKFPKRFVGEKYRHVNIHPEKIDCDKKMNDLADKANEIGLKT